MFIHGRDKNLTHNEVSPVPPLCRCEVDPVVDHDGVFVAEVVADALGAGRALSLNGVGS